MSKLLDRTVNPIGYGLMGLTWRESPPSDEAAMACMDKAYELGVNCWNGGEFYGPVERNSLHLLNKYFTKHPERAKDIVLSIKGCGKVPTPIPDGSAENVKRSIDECLHILDGKKSLDLFEAARVDPKTPIEITVGAIAEYVKAGKVGGISLSECSAESIRRAAAVHKIAAVEVELSLWETTIFSNGVAKTCAELGIPIVAYSPLGRGFLTGQIKKPEDIPDGDMRKHMPRFQPGAFEKNIELVNELQKVADKKGVTPGQVGIAWVLKQSNKPGMPLFIPIPGATTPARIEENSKLVKLTDEEDAEIGKIISSVSIVGDRYGKHVNDLNFGDSPPLKQ